MPLDGCNGVIIQHEEEGGGLPLALLHKLRLSLEPWINTRYVEPLVADYTLMLAGAPYHG